VPLGLAGSDEIDVHDIVSADVRTTIESIRTRKNTI
jgi:hypothetical protein